MLLRLVISLLRFSWAQTRTSSFTLANASLGKTTAGRGRGQTRTLNTADTVWKEEPFFFPPFLLPPESPGDRHRGGVRCSSEDITLPALNVWFSRDVRGLRVSICLLFDVPPNHLDLGMCAFVTVGMGWGGVWMALNWDRIEVLSIQGESFPSEVRPDVQPSRWQDGDTPLRTVLSFMGLPPSVLEPLLIA